MAHSFDHQPPGTPLREGEAEALAESMAAFSTPSRLKLLFALMGVERTVEDLAAATSLSANIVSQQLRVLRLLRLAAGRRDGRHIRYRLHDDHVADLLVAIRNHGEHVAQPAVRQASLEGNARRLSVKGGA
jgi:DNA-binding transcriptional ArsR family regulator